MMRSTKRDRTKITFYPAAPILEARLVKTLEELGIGRLSTYAPTLDTIQKRICGPETNGLCQQNGRNCHRFDVGVFPEIIDVELQPEWCKNS